METFDGTNKSSSEDSISHINNSPYTSLDSGRSTEESLSQKFQNVGIGSKEDGNNVSGNDQGGGGSLLPLRPYAEDCPYYLRTGTCRFGANCRYNHPVRRANQKQGKEKEKEKDKVKAKEGTSEKFVKMECKFYLTAEGCKYGKSCRFNHSKEELETSPPELNFLGLPIRLGEKECPFYMRNGSCGYGAGCRFHHPNPVDVGGYDPHSLTPNDEYVGQFSLPPAHYGGESVPLNSGALQPAQSSWSTPMLSDIAVPYQDNHSPYMPTIHFLPQEALQTHEWNGYQLGYQGPNFPQERTRYTLSPPAGKSPTKTAYTSSQVEEYPERPGAPECEYFKRSGSCKYKSACRYHHPKNQAPKEDCILNDKGLPLRPGKKICWHYEQLGICKFGRACLFDHPEDNSSTFPVGVASP